MKTKNTFTIHTELLDGKLDGARNIYMGANSTCHLYVIPREDITLANTISDISGQPAFYILVSSPDANKLQAYIGQTTDFANRKNDHLQKKDFWDLALVFISDSHKIYGDDVKYLEYLGIEAAQNAGSYELLNGANPKKPNIAPYRVNEFYTKATDRPALGTGYYDEATKKFVLLKGSILASDVVNSYKPINSRNKFIKEHCKNENGQITLQNDVPFNSPSGASGYVLGRPSNGWDDWKDAEGKKLSEVVQR